MMLEDGCGTSTLGDLNTALSVLLLTKLSARAGLLRGFAAHRPEKPRDQDHWRRGLPAVASRKARPGRICRAGIPTEGEAGGLSVKLLCKVGEGVLARLGRVDGQFTMVLVRCSIFEPPAGSCRRGNWNAASPSGPMALSRPTATSTHAGALDQRIRLPRLRRQLYDDLLEFCRQTGIKAVLP